MSLYSKYQLWVENMEWWRKLDPTSYFMYWFHTYVLLALITIPTGYFLGPIIGEAVCYVFDLQPKYHPPIVPDAIRDPSNP